MHLGYTTTNFVPVRKSKKRMIFVGEIISRILKEKRITKAEFSRLLGTTRQNAGRICTQKDIDSDMMMRVSIALGVDLFEIHSKEYRQRMGSEDVVGEAPPKYAAEKKPTQVLLEIKDGQIINVQQDVNKKAPSSTDLLQLDRKMDKIMELLKSQGTLD